MKSIKNRLRKIFDIEITRDRREALKELENELTNKGIGCYFEISTDWVDVFTIDTGSHAIDIISPNCVDLDIATQLRF